MEPPQSTMTIHNEDRDKMRQMIQHLDSTGTEPFKRVAIGALRNVLRNVVKANVEVDEWPDFSSVLIQHYHEKPALRHTLSDQPVFICYSHSGQQLERFLGKSSLIPWDKSFTVSALDGSMLEVWQRAAVCKSGTFGFHPTRQEEFRMITPSPDYIPSIDHRKSLPKGFTVGSLKPEHSTLVNSLWHRGKTETSHARIKEQIERLPTLCIYNTQGEPVSWNNTTLDGSVGIGHTMPSYRRLGLYRVNMAELMFRGAQQNAPICGYIRQGNIGAERAAVGGPQQGKLWPQTVMYGGYTPPPAAKL